MSWKKSTGRFGVPDKSNKNQFSFLGMLPRYIWQQLYAITFRLTTSMSCVAACHRFLLAETETETT